MKFLPVDMENWARKPYYDYYINFIKCRYNLSASIDVSNLVPLVKARGLRFYPTFIYVVTRVMNQNPEFRMAYDSRGRLGVWEWVSPSYTIFHKDDHTFSDIWTEWNESFSVFYENAVSDMEKYKDVKGVKGKPDQPENTYPVSAAPWLSFTGYAIDTYEDSNMLRPIITFGKYKREGGAPLSDTGGGRILLPFSVYAHHAVADGYHTCKLINEVAELAAQPEQWI